MTLKWFKVSFRPVSFFSAELKSSDDKKGVNVKTNSSVKRLQSNVLNASHIGIFSKD